MTDIKMTDQHSTKTETKLTMSFTSQTKKLKVYLLEIVCSKAIRVLYRDFSVNKHPASL